MARVTLVDFGVTDKVGMSTIKALTVHRAVQPLARKVKLVTCTEERNWHKEEVARLRKITGEGDGLRFRIVKDVDDLVRLMRGGDIFDAWKESI